MLPTITMLPETTALAAATAPAATNSSAQPWPWQCPSAPNCTGCRTMCRASMWHCGSWITVVRGRQMQPLRRNGSTATTAARLLRPQEVVLAHDAERDHQQGNENRQQ